MEKLFFYFFDPVLRSSTWGCLFLGVAASLLGVLTFIRKQSLIGETLTHATYPGVIFAALFLSFFDKASMVLMLLGALVFSFLALWILEFLIKKRKLHADASLSFVLSSFFGVGLLLVSFMQTGHTKYYKQALLYLYGQAATLTDTHVFLYVGLSVVVIGFVMACYPYLEAIYFDRNFAASIGIRTVVIETLGFFLLVLMVFLGMRTVGIVLLSGMLIAPAVAARQYTNALSKMFVLAAVFGAISGVLGNILSVEIGFLFSKKVFLPTGPMIVLTSSLIAVYSLLFAKERGVVVRFLRKTKFKITTMQENLLKKMYSKKDNEHCCFCEICHWEYTHKIFVQFLLRRMIKNGWLVKVNKQFCLTKDGQKKAAKIIRIHRLWEVYLAEIIGMKGEKVHLNAEQMEHVITNKMEQKLKETVGLEKIKERLDANAYP